MKELFSRRALITKGLIASIMVPALGLVANTVHAQNVPLDPGDATAKALGYVTSSTNPAQNCANCAQYKGTPGATTGGCTIFPGKDVAAAAYCKAWVVKPKS